MTKERVAIEFLQRVLPAGDYFYSASELIDKKFKNTAVRSFEDLAGWNLSRSQAGANAYFGCSAFAQGWHKEQPTDATNKFRTQNNAAAQKALWLDLDCGKPQSKNDLTGGALALKSFLRQTSLPVPMVVFSGAGLHAYWTMDEEIPTSRWLPMARRLKALTAALSLSDIDHSRTADAASVLRLPGTYNHKWGREVKVTHWAGDRLADELEEILTGACHQHRVTLSETPVRSLPAEGPAELVANMRAVMKGFDGPPRDPSRIVKECDQIRDMGAASYHPWYEGMTILKYCVKGNEVAHLLSRRDPRYDYATVQEKFEQALQSEAGPTRCETFDGYRPGICPECPYCGKISTPLQLGTPVQSKPKAIVAPGPALQPSETFSPVYEFAPEITYTPFQGWGYDIRPGEGVFYQKETAVVKGKDPIKEFIKISDVPFYLHHMCLEQENGRTQRQYAIRLDLPRKGLVDALFSTDDMSPEKLNKWLANHGAMPVHPNFNNLLGDCMKAYMAQIQNNLPEVHLRKFFGWTKISPENTEEGFVYGPFIYHAGGKTPVNLSNRCSRIANKHFLSHGDLESWKAIPRMYDVLDQKAAQLFFCAGFAAPFMKFGVGEAKNIVMYTWDPRGGKGKSTLLRGINSIWGHPKLSMGKANDTMSARYQLLSVKKNLPHAMDELTLMEGKDLAELLYDISTGQEKAKSTSGGNDLAETGDWQTVVFASSNRSIYEAMALYNPQGDAPSMRVLEVRCDFAGYSGSEIGRYIESTIGLMEENYGVAGAYFLEQCFANPGVFREVTTFAQEWDAKHRRHTDERFWTYSIGMSLGVGHVAKRFGLLPYDMAALDIYCQDLLASLREHIKAQGTSGSDLLVEFLSRHIDATLVVKSADRPANSRDLVSAALDNYVVHLPNRVLVARYELDSDDCYVSAEYLSEYCRRRNISLEVLLGELITEEIYDPAHPDAIRGKVTYSLGRGVSSIERGRRKCFLFNCRRLIYQEKLNAIIKTD